MLHSLVTHAILVFTLRLRQCAVSQWTTEFTQGFKRKKLECEYRNSTQLSVRVQRTYWTHPVVMPDYPVLCAATRNCVNIAVQAQNVRKRTARTTKRSTEETSRHCGHTHWVYICSVYCRMPRLRSRAKVLPSDDAKKMLFLVRSFVLCLHQNITMTTLGHALRVTNSGRRIDLKYAGRQVNELTAGVTGSICCPTLITAGTGDNLMSFINSRRQCVKVRHTCM